MHELTGHEQAVHGVALLKHSGSDALLAASGCKDGELRLWNTAEGGASVSLKLDEGQGVTGVAAAQSGETEAALYASTVAGHVHALAAEDDFRGGTAGLRVVATGGEPGPS